MKKQGKNAPSSPGVYFFKDKYRVIYIGKAQNLRTRISGYFHNSKLEERKKSMVKEANTLSWKETASDVEALILEAELIKKHRPKYNILMRDDKQYFYVGFTKEDFPKIFITHQKNNSDKKYKTDYVGPFTDGWSLRYVLKSLRKAMPYCTCVKKHKRPCQRAEIGLCLKVCCLENPDKDETAELKKNYKKNIKMIKNILSGKQSRTKTLLKKEMGASSKKQLFEEASRSRDQIFALENIFKHRYAIKRDKNTYSSKGLMYLKNILKTPVVPERIEAYDVSNIQGKKAAGAMVVFKNGQPDKNEYRKFKIKLPERPDDTAMLFDILSRRLKHKEWPLPDIIIVDGGKGQLNAALSALKISGPDIIKKIKTAALAKKEEELYLPGGKMIRLKNGPSSLLHLLQNIRNEAHRFAITYHRKRRSLEL